MDIPNLKLPEPLPNRKLSDKLEKFLNNKTIKKWNGKNIFSFFFYLYLFIKYKHSCMDLNLYLPIREFNNDFEKTEYNKDIYDLASQLSDCIKKGMSTVIIPISLIFQDGSGHANLLIYRKKDNVIEHFEPHGPMYGGVENVLVNNRIEECVKILNNVFVKNNIQPVKLIPANEVCPRIVGLQSLEGIVEKNIDVEGGGYCAVWSMFFTELVLKNPEYSSNEILSSIYRILGKMSTIDQSNYLRKVIRGYVNMIHEKIQKYFYFITDNKNVFDTIKDSDVFKVVNNFCLILEYQQKISNNPSLTKKQFIDYLLDKKMKNPYDILNNISISNIINTLEKVDIILHPSPASPGFIKTITPTPKKASPKKASPKKASPKKASLKPCPPGKERHPQTKRCRNIVAAKPDEKPVENPVEKSVITGKPCPPGKERHPQTKRCRNIQR